MDEIDKFIELVNNACRRPGMFTLNATFGEVAAIFSGIEIWAKNSPISSDPERTLDFFITSRLHVPGKYWWPGAIRLVASDDNAALLKMRELLVEFATLRRTHSLESIRELAADYEETEPARVWRRFLVARFAANEAEIQPLIMPHPDAALLWSDTPAPPGVAEQLKSISDSYVVSVVSGSLESGHVTIVTEIGKVDVHLVDGSWRLDASPIIAMSKSNKQLSLQS